MGEKSLQFWIVPIACMIIIMGIIFPYILYHHTTVISPNAVIELGEIKKMSCDEINVRNALGSYWTVDNGKFAREKVQDCKDASKALTEQLRIIRGNATHQEKLDAGFTKLWFGVYDHPKLPFAITPVQVKILPGTMNNSELFPKQLDVIIGYNNTIKWTNLDDVDYFINSDYGEFETGLIKPNETSSFTIYNPGTYGFYAKPWLTGTITVLDP